jgi:capsular exopolysaccharide synthesis family protein
MSGNLLPPAQPGPTGPYSVDSVQPAELTLGRTPAGSDEGDGAAVPWHRYVAAVKRYKWLILLIVLVGTSAGVLGTRLLPHEYETQATIWVASGPTSGGPVRGQEILGTQGWADLVRSFTVLDAVVQEHRLFVRSNVHAVFDSFAVRENFRPGAYLLQIDSTRKQYTLKSVQDSLVERGQLGDSIGRSLGMRWKPAASVLHTEELKFDVTSPRQAARSVFDRLTVQLPEEGNFMRLRLVDDDPERVTLTLNSIVDHFVLVAGDLKAFKLRETSRILEEQLTSVGAELRSAEARLESYKTQIITLPSAATPVAPGLQMTQPTVITQYLNEKIEADRLQRERETLRTALAAARAGTLNAAALQSIDAVSKSPQLLQALQDLNTAQIDLRALLTHYTDQAKPVQAARDRVDNLQGTVIPGQIQLTLASVESQVEELEAHLSTATRELQSIPTRLITEQRLERERMSLAAIYTDLQARYQTARLADATAIPDVKILDRAVRPTTPTRNQAPRLLAMVVFASVGAAFGLAVLLDRMDKRVQYPEQVTQAMGLDILGAIPALKRGRRGELAPDQAAQFIEAFRTVRVNLAHSFSNSGFIRLTITSPSAGDGKSLISSNLAISFASAGYQTVLIDGDIRRGELHRMFGIDRRPGLLDHLQGEATFEEIVRPSNQPGLWVIPCGTRRQHGPELLGSGAMQSLLEQLQQRFNAVLVDSPPLGAGVDPFVLGASTGNLLLVVRSGETDRHLAEAKLSLIDRLPIRVVGAVLNDVHATGAYRYYNYISGYSSEEEGAPAQITAQGEVR